jgi:hypothetical protein
MAEAGLTKNSIESTLKDVRPEVRGSLRKKLMALNTDSLSVCGRGGGVL